jgi:tetratricopeptide (TPR) repeat protein
MKKNNLFLTAAIISALTVLLFMPLSSNAYQLFHTLQTGSFASITPAKKQFNSIVQKLDEKDLDKLRIEKIGKYYSVRLGQFTDSATASVFLESIKDRVNGAAVMTAYIKEERIKKSYSGSFTSAEQPIDENKLQNIQKAESEPDTTDKAESTVTPTVKIAEIAALVEKTDFNAALEIIVKEIATQPLHPELNAWYGMVMLKKAQPSEALKYLKKAAELSPGISDYHNGIGYSLFLLNKYDNAINAFMKAVQLDPGHPDALTGLCISYAKSGKREMAMDIYDKLKYIDKESAEKALIIIEKST